MAIIQCPECKHEVSDQAVSCPHCGYPIAERISKKKKSSRAGVTIAIISIVIIALAAAASWWIFFRGGGDNEETKAYETIVRFEQENNVDSLECALNRYLDTYNPDAQHYSQVKDMGDRFFAERDEWKHTESQNSVEAIHCFLDDHPVGYFHTTALNRLDSLQFAIALSEDTKEAYEFYLTRYGEGLYVNSARLKIDSIDKVLITKKKLIEEAARDSLANDTLR